MNGSTKNDGCNNPTYYVYQWDDLWSLIINDDVHDFDISRNGSIICRIRMSDKSTWKIMFSTSRYHQNLIGKTVYSKPELLALVGLLSNGEIRHVKCLPKSKLVIEGNVCE